MDQGTPRGTAIRRALFKLAGVCLGVLSGPLAFVTGICLLNMLSQNAQSRLVEDPERDCGLSVIVDLAIVAFCTLLVFASAVVAARTIRRIASNRTKDGEVVWRDDDAEL